MTTPETPEQPNQPRSPFTQGRTPQPTPESTATDGPADTTASSAQSATQPSPITGIKDRLATISRRNLAIGGGLAAALLLVIGGCAILTGSDDIQTADGKIINADTFLADATQTWRSGLPTEGVTVHDDAECFYVLIEDKVTGKIACGGVRRYGYPEGKVWDTATFTPVTLPDGEATATDLTWSENSVRRPAGDLRDAEGNSASDDLDDVKEPDLPTAKAGAVIPNYNPGTIARTDEVKPGEANRVITPNTSITFTSISTIGAVIADEEGQYAPAKGETFRLFTFTSDPANSQVADAETEFVLDHDGTLTDIPVEPDETTKGSFVVSVSKGDTVVITFDGHEQRIDPFTGKRKADPIADVFYRPGSTQDINKPVHWADKPGNHSGDDYKITHAATVTTATLTPYLPSKAEAGAKGWATKGTTWLLLEVETNRAENDGDFAINVNKTIDTWTATVDGKPYPAPAPITLESSWGKQTIYVAFAVPATTTAVDISAASTSTISRYDSPAATTTVDMGTQTFPVAFK